MPRAKIDRKELIERLQKKYSHLVVCVHEGIPYTHRIDFRLRIIWRGIISRCGKLNYKNISVCDEWLTFETFKEWAMDNKWEKGKHLHRVDNAGNYKPDNVVIITAREHGLVHKIPSG